MATLNLADQQILRDAVAPRINQLKNAMENRKDIWQKIPYSKKKRWIQSEKDPVMTLAYQIYKYLDDNFFGPKHVNKKEV